MAVDVLITLYYCCNSNLHKKSLIWLILLFDHGCLLPGNTYYMGFNFQCVYEHWFQNPSNFIIQTNI